MKIILSVLFFVVGCGDGLMAGPDAKEWPDVSVPNPPNVSVMPPDDEMQCENHHGLCGEEEKSICRACRPWDQECQRRHVLKHYGCNICIFVVCGNDRYIGVCVGCDCEEDYSDICEDKPPKRKCKKRRRR